MRYSNIHCVTGKGFCLKKSKKTYFGTMEWPALLLQLMKPNPSTHSDMVWGRASHECYPRSFQGHLKVTAWSNQLKMDENNLFLFLFLQLCPLKMSMVVQTYLEPNTELHQTHFKTLQGFFRGQKGTNPIKSPLCQPCLM